MSAHAHLVVTARRSAMRARVRVAMSAALVAAAVVVGSPGAVPLALLALLLVIDAVVPLPGLTRSEADERFRALVRERRRAERMHGLRGLPPEQLDVVDDLRDWHRRPLGIEMIEIDSVTGTVEAIKAKAFDRRFRPDRTAALRWKGLWLAHAHNVVLPPVTVYRVGAEHVVRDGHHRISVARDRGLSMIEAEVVELQRREG
jgi:hypothetical protein